MCLTHRFEGSDSLISILWIRKEKGIADFVPGSTAIRLCHQLFMNTSYLFHQLNPFFSLEIIQRQLRFSQDQVDAVELFI